MAKGCPGPRRLTRNGRSAVGRFAHPKPGGPVGPRVHCRPAPRRRAVTCQAKCEASCSGSCTAKANVDCDVSCQATGYANCEAMLTGGCQAQCTTPQGALFCDGQYVDTGNNLQQCISD